MRPLNERSAVGIKDLSEQDPLQYICAVLGGVAPCFIYADSVEYDEFSTTLYDDNGEVIAAFSPSVEISVLRAESHVHLMTREAYVNLKAADSRINEEMEKKADIEFSEAMEVAKLAARAQRKQISDAAKSALAPETTPKPGYL
jgi:hypothetical protein